MALFINNEFVLYAPIIKITSGFKERKDFTLGKEYKVLQIIGVDEVQVIVRDNGFVVINDNGFEKMLFDEEARTTDDGEKYYIFSY